MAGAGRKEITMKSWRIHLLATTAFLAAAALVLAGPASALRRSEEAFGAGPSGVPVSTPGGGGSGLDWISVGAGAAIALGALALAAATALVVVRRRRTVAAQ
ncbi:MAG TPA: hypothetical protein VFB26_07985 [Gaiellaceae bacterium]|nr:hypothetical protein [Gaiellaceae bacterium]